jgi:hypothetical protein
MKSLNIYTQGVKGGQVKNSTQGYISVYTDNSHLLTIENYKGSGDTYEQRPEPIIIIFDGLDSPNEKVVFEGTHQQLIEKLK